MHEKWSLIRQKGESQNRCFKKTKDAKFYDKRIFFTPGGKKCSFFEKIDVLYFLETSVLRLALLPYYRRNTCFKISRVIAWY